MGESLFVLILAFCRCLRELRFQLRNLHGRVPGFVSYNAVCVMSGVRPSRGVKLNTIDGFGVGRVSVQSAVGLRRLMVRLARVGRFATRDSLQKVPVWTEGGGVLLLAAAAAKVAVRPAPAIGVAFMIQVAGLTLHELVLVGAAPLCR